MKKLRRQNFCAVLKFWCLCPLSLCKHTVVEKQRALATVDKMKELQCELAETRQKMANLAKQNSEQLTNQVCVGSSYHLMPS